MRILFAYDGISPIGGGSQIATLTWIKNLLKLGIEIKLLCNESVIPSREGISKQNLIINNPLDLSFLYPDFNISLKLYRETTHAILQFKPNIIHLNEPSLLTYQLVSFAKSNGISTLMTYHTNYKKGKVNNFPMSLLWNGGNGIANILIDTLQSSMLRKSDYITAASKTFQISLQQKFNKPVFLNPYPIQKLFFQKNLRLPKRINKLISVSRLSGEKNIEILIAMMKYLKNDFELTIIGDGIDMPYLKKQVEDLDLKNIAFLGRKTSSDIAKELLEHHLFLSPSSYETFGITYIEALASMIPCIVYDYSTSREIIPNDMALFINDYRPKKWAEELMKIQKRPKIYEILKAGIRNGYEKIMAFNEDESTKKLIKIYEEIMTEKYSTDNRPGSGRKT